MTRIAAALALAVALTTACSPAHARFRRTVEKADHALSRGDLFRAADHLFLACEQRPADPVCARAQEVGRTAIAGAVERADTACAADDLDRCIAELQPARDRRPDDPDVRRVFALAVERRIASCSVAGPPGKGTLACLEGSRDRFESPELLAAIDEARAAVALSQEREAASVVATCETKSDPSGLETIRCLQAAKNAGVAAPSLERALGDARVWSARFFHQLAEGTPSAGAAAAAWSVAGCLVPEEEARVRRLESLARLERASAVPIRVVVGGSGAATRLRAEDLCEIVAANNPAVRCASTPDALVARVDLDLSEAVHSRSSATKSLPYKKGERVFVNPAYAPAQDRVARAERDLRRAESEADTANLACERASGAHTRASYCWDCAERIEKELQCKAADLGREARSRRQAELAAARSDASRIPELLREAENAELVYVETTHRWTATLDTTIRLGDSRPERFIDTIVFQDTERDSAAAAGVGADPLEDPPRDYFVRGISGHVRARLPKILDAALAQRAAARQMSCSGNPVWSAEWLECWAETRYWKRQPIDAAPLLALSNATIPCR